jgi:hypothetical protein
MFFSSLVYFTITTEDFILPSALSINGAASGGTIAVFWMHFDFLFSVYFCNLKKKNCYEFLFFLNLQIHLTDFYFFVAQTVFATLENRVRYKTFLGFDPLLKAGEIGSSKSITKTVNASKVL